MVRHCRRPERAGCAPDVRVVEVGHCYLVRVQRHTTRRYYRARVISLNAHLANLRLLDTGEASSNKTYFTKIMFDVVV